MPCTVKGILDGSYAKYPSGANDQVIMEYAPFTEYVANYLPSPLDTNPDFISYFNGQLPG
jgi:hypothetical protein